MGVSAVQYVPPVSPGSTEYLVPEYAEKPSTAEQRREALSVLRYRYPLQVMGKQILVETPLVGRHQLRNVALAIAAAEELSKKGLPRNHAQIDRARNPRDALARAISGDSGAADGWPEIVLDVAHNPAGAWALRSALSERYGDRPLIFVFGAMRDKAISEMTEILFPLAHAGDCDAAGQSAVGIAGRNSSRRGAGPERRLKAVAEVGTGAGARARLSPGKRES